MSRMLTDEDLSLRHLPENSNYSFSFQIPASSLPKGDDLMADDNTFFEGLNAQSVLATPAPPAQFRTRSSPRALPEFTQRPSSLEPSTHSQQARTLVSSESPSTSYGHSELRPSPIIEVHKLSNDLESSEAEDLNKEKATHEHQHPEERQEQGHSHSAPTAPSAKLNDILSPVHAFAERSSLGSWPEAGHSRIDFPQTELRSQTGSAIMDETKMEQESIVNSPGTRINLSAGGSEQSAPIDKPQMAAGAKPVRKSKIMGGILKLRSVKAAKSKNERHLVDFSLPTITSRAVQRNHNKPMGSTAADQALFSDLNLTSFISSEVSAARLVMYGEQLRHTRDEAADSTIKCTEPNYLSDHRGLGEGEIQDVNMKDDRQVDPCTEHHTHANKSGDRDDDRDDLTISQLSPRKRSMWHFAALEQQDNDTASLPPSLPVFQPRSGVPRKKRQAPTASGPYHNQRTHNRGKGTMNAVNVEALSSLATIVPVHPIASTSNGQLSALTPAVPAVLSEAEYSSSGAVLNGSGVMEKNEGGKEDTYEENVADIGHAKATRSSDMMSTSGDGHPARSDSGEPINAKEVVKRPVEIRARNRTRMAPKISASVNRRMTLRPRSVSNSVVTRAEAKRASERGRRLARTRKKGEARGSRAARLERDSGEAKDSEPKCSDAIHPMTSTRPIEFKFATDLRIRGRREDGEKMSRSTSSMSSSGSDPMRAHLIPDFKKMHAHLEASQMHRKENIHPVTAQPFQWATDQRIVERKQYDGMIKEKEREREQAEEQRQRERAEEEEREIRELRRKAIPKANVVPEWYKDAPKRKRDEEERLGMIVRQI